MLEGIPSSSSLPPSPTIVLAFYLCHLKDYSQEDVTARFKPYGEIEYCKVIKDKQTTESKGFAYVKFAKASAAALAMEEVNRLAQENGIHITFSFISNSSQLFSRTKDQSTYCRSQV